MPEKAMSRGLSHLYLTVFLFNFSGFMVMPTITDVSMEALCPGEDECSLVIYLTGVQQAIICIGNLVTIPLIGNLSDHYGRKLLITFPMMLAIFPTGICLTWCLETVILAYSREREFFYAYYVVKTFTSMCCEGAVLCLAHAYVADNVAEQRRGSAFGILCGISACSFVLGNLLTRFLPSNASVFQVSAAMAMVAVVYMRILLPESDMESSVIAAVSFSKEDETTECLLENRRPVRTTPSLRDSISLLTRSWAFSQVVIVSFFSKLGDLGLLSALMYYLKAEFQFDTDQFADLSIIEGVAGIVSQIILMPLLARVINEEKLLSIGLAFNCIHMFLFAVAWSSWVVYLSPTLQILALFAAPSLRSIVSKQVGPTEQGKAQGCITAIDSFAGIISPLVFSPLTALFLSDHAPFHFPGFSLMCAAFAVMIAFIQSIMIKAAPALPHLPVSGSRIDKCDSVEP